MPDVFTPPPPEPNYRPSMGGFDNLSQAIRFEKLTHLENVYDVNASSFTEYNNYMVANIGESTSGIEVEWVREADGYGPKSRIASAGSGSSYGPIWVNSGGREIRISPSGPVSVWGADSLIDGLPAPAVSGVESDITLSEPHVMSSAGDVSVDGSPVGKTYRDNSLVRFIADAGSTITNVAAVWGVPLSVFLDEGDYDKIITGALAGGEKINIPQGSEAFSSMYGNDAGEEYLVLVDGTPSATADVVETRWLGASNTLEGEALGSFGGEVYVSAIQY